MKYNRGFTLAELLIVITIIGVLTALAIITFKPYDKGIKYLHSNTYYALNRAFYNVMNEYRDQNLAQRDPFQVENEDLGTSNLTHTRTKDDGTRILCEGLTHYINFVERNCTNVPISSDALAYTEAGQPFANETPHFIAVNGVRFFISERLGTNSIIANTGQKGVYFYLIFADLNGTKFPNNGSYVPVLISGGEDAPGNKRETTKDPDVFVFAAFGGYEDENGFGLGSDSQLIPIGIAEFEPRYMLTRIIYTDPEDHDAYIKYSKGSQPYYLSKCEAWGYYNPTNNSEGAIYANADDSKIKFMPDDPHTFNDYVRSQLASSEAYKDSFILKNIEVWEQAYARLNNLDGFSATGNSCSKPVRNDINCAVGADFVDSCSVIIDKYVY